MASVTAAPATPNPTKAPTPSPISNVEYTNDDTSNVVVFIMSEIPFTKEWSIAAPKGLDLENGETVEYGDYPIPNIQGFMNETVVFTKSYCGAPDAAPSRFVVLTGRYSTRSQWALERTPKSYDRTIIGDTGNTSRMTRIRTFGLVLLDMLTPWTKYIDVRQ